MDTVLGYFDTSTKRWLAVLAVSVLASVVFLERSFMNVLAPQENIVTVEQSASGGAGEVQTRSEPAFDNQAQVHGQEASPIVNRVSPFDNPQPKVRKIDPVAHQEMVHQEADYLRKLIAAGKLPKGFGNLTKEQVDEMEKKGLTID